VPSRTVSIVKSGSTHDGSRAPPPAAHSNANGIAEPFKPAVETVAHKVQEAQSDDLGWDGWNLQAQSRPVSSRASSLSSVSTAQGGEQQTGVMQYVLIIMAAIFVLGVAGAGGHYAGNYYRAQQGLEVSESFSEDDYDQDSGVQYAEKKRKKKKTKKTKKSSQGRYLQQSMEDEEGFSD